MKLNDLPVEDQELILAFVDAARSECAGRTWDEIEPVLGSIWSERHGGTLRNRWREIAPFIRSVCDQTP
jgi:hypothetical protein